MTKTEYLLICLMEEAAEVQLAASKALRFGFDNYHPDRPKQNNLQELNIEVGDLIGVISALKGCEILDLDVMTKQNELKQQKLKDYMKLSVELGIVEG